MPAAPTRKNTAAAGAHMDEELANQYEKGRVAAAMAMTALDSGAQLDDLLNDYNREMWREMHPVAHLWLAFPGGPESRSDYATAEMRRRLLMAERFLDRMQDREDLRHPDPWRLSPEVRAELEAEAAETARSTATSMTRRHVTPEYDAEKLRSR